MSGAYPLEGEEWREGGLVPPHGRTKYKLSCEDYDKGLKGGVSVGKGKGDGAGIPERKCPTSTSQN